MAGNSWPAQYNWPGSSAIVTATPLTIITSSPPKMWVDARLGASANTWLDQTANGNNFTEGVVPPSLGTLGGNACFTGNGTTQRFRNATLTVTANQWYWVIGRQISGTGSLCGGRASAFAAVFGTGVAPELSIYSGVSGAPNSSAAYGSWVRLKWLCTGNAGLDYLQIASNKQPGTGGANAEVGWDIFCRAGVAFGNWAIAAIVVCPAEPSPGEQSNLDTQYGNVVFTGVSF